MINPLKLPDIVARFLDAPYKLGGKTKQEGYDCLSFFYCFMQGIGVDLGKSYNGYTMDNYSERWEAGAGRKEWEAFLKSLGQPIEVINAMPADIMVFRVDGGVFPGIYLGNQHVLTCFLKYGVMVVPMKNIEQSLVEVRRIG